MTVPTLYELPATPGLAVSFQRFPCPAAGRLSALPRSCGALPIALVGPGALVVPCPAGEALWIGLVRAAPRVRPCRVVVLAALGTDVVDVPPTNAVAGLPCEDGTVAAFAAATCPHVALTVVEGGVELARLGIELVDADTFASLTGLRLPELDPSAAYDGRRLP